MPVWTIKTDRRTNRREEIVSELNVLEKTVRGLQVEIASKASFEEAPDAGKFRDFIPLARIIHEEEVALEYVAEELIDTFGWEVDFEREEKNVGND